MTLNYDYTFYHQDFSISNKKIIVNGNWSQQGTKEVLQENTTTINFHKVLTFCENGKVSEDCKKLSF